VVAPAIMSGVNGCETMIYLAIYDLGAVVLGRNSAISFLLGLLTFNSYSYIPHTYARTSGRHGHFQYI
jgi:hypothetical protein